jgi:hypothetical protein
MELSLNCLNLRNTIQAENKCWVLQFSARGMLHSFNINIIVEINTSILQYIIVKRSS